MSTLFKSAKYVFRTEGFIAMLQRGFAFLTSYFFRYRTLYLYGHTVGQGNEAEFMPRVQDFILKVVSTNQQADELAARGLDFRWQVGNTYQRLEKGAIAFCVFVGRDLAHIGWIAPTQEAKESLHEPPYKVAYSNGEVCTGSTWTNPKYRGKGLMAYGYFKRLQFLSKRGILVARAAVDRDNIVSQKVHAKFSPNMYAQARYLKILCWKFWKEESLKPTLP